MIPLEEKIDGLSPALKELYDVLAQHSFYISIEQLHHLVYSNSSYIPKYQIIRTHVFNLRKKLGKDSVLNKSGFGYKLNPEYIIEKPKSAVDDIVEEAIMGILEYAAIYAKGYRKIADLELYVDILRKKGILSEDRIMNVLGYIPAA